MRASLTKDRDMARSILPCRNRRPARTAKAKIKRAHRHAIATDYSAHTEYLTPANARLIEIDELEDARDPRWTSTYSTRGTGQWAHLGARQVEQLVHHLREVHEDRVAGRLGRNDTGIETARSFSWANTATAIETALT